MIQHSPIHPFPPVSVEQSAATTQELARRSVLPRVRSCVVARVHHGSAATGELQQCRSSAGKESTLASTSARRRADLSVDEALDVRDWAQELVDHIAEALADDGVVDLEEAQRSHVLSQRIVQEAEESVVMTEWVDAGELQALSKLLGRDSARAAAREHQVRQRANEIGLSLAGTT